MVCICMSVYRCGGQRKASTVRVLGITLQSLDIAISAFIRCAIL